MIYDLKDAGAQAWANWKEKEVVTGKGLEKNAGGPIAALGTLITAEPQSAKVVTIEAESELEACEAVLTFYSRGITNPGGSALAVVQQGLGGGWANNKALAAVTTAVKEETLTP